MLSYHPIFNKTIASMSICESVSLGLHAVQRFHLNHSKNLPGEVCSRKVNTNKVILQSVWKTLVEFLDGCFSTAVYPNMSLTFISSCYSVGKLDKDTYYDFWRWRWEVILKSVTNLAEHTYKGCWWWLGEPTFTRLAKDCTFTASHIHN